MPRRPFTLKCYLYNECGYDFKREDLSLQLQHPVLRLSHRKPYSESASATEEPRKDRAGCECIEITFPVDAQYHCTPARGRRLSLNPTRIGPHHSEGKRVSYCLVETIFAVVENRRRRRCRLALMGQNSIVKVCKTNLLDQRLALVGFSGREAL